MILVVVMLMNESVPTPTRVPSPSRTSMGNKGEVDYLGVVVVCYLSM